MASSAAAGKPWLMWLIGLSSSAALVAYVVSGWAPLESDPASAWRLLVLVPAVPIAILLCARPFDEPLPCALAAGLGAGIAVGMACSLASPAYWFSPDTAWHTAKLATVAAGAPLHDPIYQVPSLYPFAWHALLGAVMGLGFTTREVMTAVPVVAISASSFMFWCVARHCMEDRSAAWLSLAFPLVFHAPLLGYILLPEPFNSSLALVFAALLSLLWGDASGKRRGVLAAGFLLGLAGLFWYGHLVWVVLFVVLLGFVRRALVAPLVLGGLPAALVLLCHLLSLPEGAVLGGGVLVVSDQWSLGERLLGMARNFLSLSGSAELSSAPWWIGASVLVLLGSKLARWQEIPRSHHLLLALLASLGACLLWAGLALRYWEPFSWRYASLFWAVALLVAAWRGDLQLGSRSLPAVAPLAVLAMVSVSWSLYPVVHSSVLLAEQHQGSGSDLVAFIEEHTQADEPVFASIATWEHALGCCVPRPNLADRDGGTYKYAPAAVAEPRFADYLAVAEASDPHRLLQILSPYGFRHAVLHRMDLKKPGYLVLASSFPVLFKNDRYLVVALDRGPLTPP